MAQSKKTSRADKAVSDKQKNIPAPKQERKPKKASTKAPKVTTQFKKAANDGASDIVAACIYAVLFILYLVICLNPDGFLLKIIQSVVLGLFGQAGFYFSIPAFFFLFMIHIFGRKTNLKLRSLNIYCFVLCCGSLFHLIIQRQGMAEGFAIIRDLYVGGTIGISGGVICGGLAVLLRWACGNVMSYLILGIVAVLTLLASMQITIPSIIRAIANRPRENWVEDDEQEEVYVEPAAVVVNHIANRQIERERSRRQKMAERERQAVQQQVPVQIDVPQEEPSYSRKLRQPVIPEQLPSASPEAKRPAPVSATPANAARIMNVFDSEPTPPPAAKRREEPPVSKPAKPAVPVFVEPEETVDIIQEKMPELEQDSIPYTPPKIPVRESPKPEKKSAAKPEPKPGKVSTKDAEESAIQVAAEIARAQTVPAGGDYCFPPIDLLKKPFGPAADGTDEMRENSRRLNETLASFRIDAHIINVTRGPSVTRYEVELDKGVRLNKLTTCADDIALSLGASGVRIAAVPGKISIVGIEVPNRAVTTVSLREVIDSNEFNKAKSKSSFAVGKDIGGSCIVGNISKMPHMLIAGTTGSGKSVCMNSIIISLLYKSGPEDVKLIMVDPKMVELGIYNGIPHLLIPVVTDPKKAAGSLQWAVTEMLRRYKMMSDVGVRDLESYNSIVTAEEGGQKLPQVVIIIDELADLMLVAAKEVEDSICRIAQMGRAAGMHLIIATQRPSADVITGLMKANIPSRIAFSVASAMESRIILDTQGAEKLVGKGDMLYAPIGIGKPLRVQGCFVTDGEVEAVAGYVKEHYVADYNQQVLEEIEKKAQQTGKTGKASGNDFSPNDDEMEGDEMLPAAVEVILETGQASVSMLQRRLKLGYSRAARIVDEMEEKGIVGPSQGAKPRSILITKEQWASMQGGGQSGFDDLESVPEELSDFE